MTTSVSVNRPTNLEQKEQDVNQKLQLYGIITAFSNGKAPSNEQIDVALNSFLRTSFMTSPSEKLSAEGQGLVKDLHEVVTQAKYMILTKNEGNLLQDFFWQTQQLDSSIAVTPNMPTDSETARRHGDQALDGLRTLGTLIISNGQFRKLLNDATILLRDIAGDIAQNAAKKVNPSDGALAQIDRPAEDNTWHDIPDMSTGNIKSQIKQAYSKNTPLSKQDVRDAAGDAAETANPDGSRDPADAAIASTRDQNFGRDSRVDTVTGFQSGISTLKDRASGNIDDHTKDRLGDSKNKTQERVKNYLTQKMPDERRDQTIWRLRKMVIEIQGHPDYLQAVNTLLDLAETYAGHANVVAQQSVESVKSVHADDSLTRAEADLKTLIERFANNTSSDDLWSSINQIYRDADRDPELKSWFKQIDSYVRKCLQVQGYIIEDQATDEWNELYNRGSFLLRDRYRNHTDRVIDEMKFLADQFNTDSQNRHFADACQKLFYDLGNDENGKPTFKPHLVKDLTEVILPAMFENIRYVPIPRIEYSDPTIDSVIENLVIESDNLMPNAIELASDNYWRWGRKNISNRNKNSVMVSITGVQMDLRDVSYYVKKKRGFPSITDLGVADIFLGGSGLSLKIKMSTTDAKDRQNFFQVDKVDVDVKNFNIKLKQSRHKILFGLFKPIMLKVLRPGLQKVIEKAVKDKVQELDAIFYAIQQEANRSKAEAQYSPDNFPNIYSRYANAAQKKLLKGRKKVEAVGSNKKVNMAITQSDSIFPNIKLPGGISSKATEYKELAAKGEKWESPVFSIGTASRTSDIPSAGPITRKDHPATQGGVRGRDNLGNTESMTNQARQDGALKSTQLGYGTDSSTNVGNGSANTAGFSDQVDQAFSKDTTAANGTTLGSRNPALNGSTWAH